MSVNVWADYRRHITLEMMLRVMRKEWYPLLYMAYPCPWYSCGCKTV